MREEVSHDLDCRQTAHRLREMGMQVILVDNGDLLHCDWPSRDYTPEQIDDEFKKQPSLNVGIVLGKSSGLIEVCGFRRGSQRDIDDLFDYQFPDTAYFESEFGLHFLFEYNDALAKLGESQFSYNSLDITVGTPDDPAFSILPPSIVDDVPILWWQTFEEGVKAIPNRVVDKIIEVFHEELLPPLPFEVEVPDLLEAEFGRN